MQKKVQSQDSKMKNIPPDIYRNESFLFESSEIKNIRIEISDNLCFDPNYFSENTSEVSNLIEKRYLLEDEMLDNISRGNFEESLRLFNELQNYKITPRSSDSFRNQQNLLIILNTLCRKILSIKNNIHPLYLDDISTKMAILINSATDEKDLKKIPREILRKYCILATNYSLRGYSHIVQKVATYIEFHFTEEISLSLMAKKHNVSRTYLSSIFKKDTGYTLTDYLHHIRIKRSLLLIHTTTFSISQIASVCGYSDLNYFIRIFKKFNGQSPKQYSKQVTCQYKP